MAKKKISIDKDGLKSMFIKHVEKIVFGVCLVLFFTLVYFGTKVDSLADNQTPVRLREIAQQKRRDLDSSTFEPFSKIRTHNPKLVDEVKNVSGLDPSGYGPIVMFPTPPKPKTFRRDPELRKISDLTVQGGYYAIALNAPSKELINLVPFAKKEETKKQAEDEEASSSPGFGSFPSSGGSGRPGGFPGSMPGGVPGGGSGGSGGSGRPGGFPGSFPGGMPGGVPGGGGMPGGVPGGGAGGAGVPGLAVAEIPDRTVPLQQQKEIIGVAGKIGPEAYLYKGYAVCVTALFPHDLQKAEYETKFKDALGYDPNRDVPRYGKLQVERSSDNGASWTDISDLVTKTYPERYLVPVREVVKSKFTDPALTMPIPPAVIGDPFGFASHKLVEFEKFYVEQKAEDGAATPANQDDVFNSPAAANPGNTGGYAGMPGGMPGGVPGSGPGGFRGSMPPGGMPGGVPGGMPGGVPGSSMPGSSMPGMAQGGTGSNLAVSTEDSEYKLIRFFDLQAKPGETYQYRVRIWMVDPNSPDSPAVAARPVAVGGAGMPGMPGMPGGMPGGVPGSGPGGFRGSMPPGGMPGGVPGGMPGGVPGSSPPGGLPGGIPGSSAGGSSTASSGEAGASNGLELSDLAPEVRKRIREWTDSQKDLIAKTPEFAYLKPTEWSEPTTALIVPDSEHHFYAGNVEDTKLVASGENVRFRDGERTAKIAVASFAPEYGVTVNIEKTVLPGSVLSFVDKVTMMNPFDWSLRTHGKKYVPVEGEENKPGNKNKAEDTIEPYPIVSGSIVLDMLGGMFATLKGSEGFKTLGEVVVVDPSGKVSILDEFSDIQDYRHTMFVEDEPEAGAAAAVPGGFPPGGMPGGVPGAGGRPGGFPGSFPGGVPGGTPGAGSRPGGTR